MRAWPSRQSARCAFFRSTLGVYGMGVKLCLDKYMMCDFDAETGFGIDACEIDARTRSDKLLADYVFSGRPSKCKPPSGCKRLPAVYAATERLDSSATHDRCRQQLSTRVFQAVPQLFRGEFSPDVESRMQGGHDPVAQCRADVRDKPWDVFNPAVQSSCWQDPNNIVLPWPQSGVSSRDAWLAEPHGEKRVDQPHTCKPVLKNCHS
jgi:hypothetical protein